MPHISIISASVRSGRQSHRVALYLKKYVQEKKWGTVEILDLKEYNFPIFSERLRKQKNPDKQVMDFAEKIKSSDGIIIVSPEYNGGYPAALKNVIDLLYDEWKRKPVSFATVSSSAYGGTQVITSLQFSLWKMGAWTVPVPFSVSRVQDMFEEDGSAKNKAETDKQADGSIQELMWCLHAKKNAIDSDKYLLIA